MQLSEHHSVHDSKPAASHEGTGRLGKILRVLRPVKKLLDDHEVTVLKYAQGHVRALGYAQNAVLGVAAAGHLIDGYTAFSVAMTFNLLGIGCTWGTLAYYGAHSDSKLRQLWRFVKLNAQSMWDDPDNGVDKVKESVVQKCESIDGKWGNRLREGLRYYGVVRRLPVVGYTIHTARILMQNDLKLIKDVYDTVTLDHPTEYFVSLPVSEYGKQPDWIYSLPLERTRPTYRKIVVE